MMHGACFQLRSQLKSSFYKTCGAWLYVQVCMCMMYSACASVGLVLEEMSTVPVRMILHA